jgi:predicted transcriptional regulator
LINFDSEGSLVETKVVTAHVPTELAAKVDAIAARRDRSRGWIMKQALRAWVEQEEQRYRLTLEALADVDAGRTVDHDDVEKWVDSLDSDRPLPMPT